MSLNRKTKKSYNAYAEKWAEKMRSGQNIAHTYLEKPAMYDTLPNVRGKSVLCIGCGTGEECYYLKSQGAKYVIGIDISNKLIDVARQSYPGIEFEVMDMEKLVFPQKKFDVVYSSLALHYVKNWTRVLENIHRVLKVGGVFLFSTHHPAKWGAEIVRGKKKNTFMLGYEKSKDSDDCKIHGDYLTERKINDTWFDEFPVSYYHKPISTIVKSVLEAGFEILDFLEPKAVTGAKKVKNNFWHIHQKIPLFMILKLKRK
ncbi:MAG: hypothetical protein COT81_03960 [Candidatus Buchananbacteria bacterium CG10_big_fil_rev_8_21_14_0_10_42_9]|uniref:Methyltransferase type 11 domain-containing protein n=1 Tax=Candidatus Buchananbacteria bacterium CG10_big_fil_rev_8_21_14_0_10_42_9 TaxID=1974526 RepID=A0A2H0W0N0_9BACT|nr:MAG: hypothetical protein COT81_03960 [Candidatus Buchananbacteria bacterium CG10_big_fil_rev_8_21_14_0_10_42_9]